MSETRPGTYAEGVEHGLALKQAEVDRMGRRFGELQAENSELKAHINGLEDYIAQLEEVLRNLPNPNVSLSA